MPELGVAKRRILPKVGRKPTGVVGVFIGGRGIGHGVLLYCMALTVWGK
ncbi:MAG: hypothetical protein O3B43_01700 [Chloroflexi bacterium]|nr:hypothetical protein [Chloroflexota bacterium]